MTTALQLDRFKTSSLNERNLPDGLLTPGPILDQSLKPNGWPVSNHLPANGVPNGSGSNLQAEPTSPRRHFITPQNLVASSDNETLLIQKNAQRVGRYRVIRTIGKGNFAKVKLAVHMTTGCEVAIKIIDRSSLNETCRIKLEREIRVMKSIVHPNIVRLYEVINTPRYVYLVMEYARNGEIYNRLLKKGRMSESEARVLIRQLFSAVEYCHQKHIVHRDLKTENLLLDADNNLKLADFGFANHFSSDRKLDTFCGSPPYAAPELLCGQKYHGPEVDVWALGVILYMLVCGQLPFQAHTLRELHNRILRGRYRIPFFMTSSCENMLKKMLVLNPNKRLPLRELMNEQWINIGFESNPLRPYIEPPLTYSDPVIAAIMKQMGFHSDEIRDAFENRRFNDVTATYLLIPHTEQWRAMSSGRHSRAGDNAIGLVGSERPTSHQRTSQAIGMWPAEYFFAWDRKSWVTSSLRDADSRPKTLLLKQSSVNEKSTVSSMRTTEETRRIYQPTLDLPHLLAQSDELATEDLISKLERPASAAQDSTLMADPPTQPASETELESIADPLAMRLRRFKPSPSPSMLREEPNAASKNRAARLTPVKDAVQTKPEAAVRRSLSANQPKRDIQIVSEVAAKRPREKIVTQQRSPHVNKELTNQEKTEAVAKPGTPTPSVGHRESRTGSREASSRRSTTPMASSVLSRPKFGGHCDESGTTTRQKAMPQEAPSKHHTEEPKPANRHKTISPGDLREESSMKARRQTTPLGSQRMSSTPVGSHRDGILSAKSREGTPVGASPLIRRQTTPVAGSHRRGQMGSLRSAPAEWPDLEELQEMQRKKPVLARWVHILSPPPTPTVRPSVKRPTVSPMAAAVDRPNKPHTVTQKNAKSKNDPSTKTEKKQALWRRHTLNEQSQLVESAKILPTENKEVTKTSAGPNDYAPRIIYIDSPVDSSRRHQSKRDSQERQTIPVHSTQTAARHTIPAENVPMIRARPGSTGSSLVLERSRTGVTKHPEPQVTISSVYRTGARPHNISSSVHRDSQLGSPLITPADRARQLQQSTKKNSRSREEEEVEPERVFSPEPPSVVSTTTADKPRKQNWAFGISVHGSNAHVLLLSTESILYDKRIQYARAGPFKLLCTYTPVGSAKSLTGQSSENRQTPLVSWEMEVIHIPRLRTYGVRLKYLAGDAIQYRKLEKDIISQYPKAL